MRALEIRFDRLPRYAVLLTALFAELILAPALAATETGLVATRIATVAVLLAAVFAAEAGRVGLALFALAIAMQVVVNLTSIPYTRVVELSLRVAFVGYVTGVLLLTMLQREAVSLDTIAGAACTYMLIGAVWSAAFLLLEEIHPGSFEIPPEWRSHAGDAGPGLVYFSYSTLTTVGYGDIRPLWPAAGGLAIAEAVVGQLYLAITVARLVGLHVSRPR